MSVQDVVDYVLQSPQNTNPAILKQMIRENSNSSGSGSDIFIVHASVDVSQDESVVSVTESYDDIASAIQDGKYVLMHVQATDGEGINPNVEIIPLVYSNLEAKELTFSSGTNLNTAPGASTVSIEQNVMMYMEDSETGEGTWQNLIVHATVDKSQG